MLLEIDGTLIVVQLSFIVFMAIMYFILLKPMQRIMSEREEFLSKNLKTVKESGEKADNLIAEKNNKIKDTQIEASNMLSEKTKNAKDKKSESLKIALENSKNKIDLIKENLEKEKVQVQDELKGKIEDFSNDIVLKILEGKK